MIAKDLVRTKSQINQMTSFSGQLKAVSLRIGSISTLNEMSNAMEETSKAMCLVSNKLDATKLQKMAKSMAMEDGKLDMKQEMMSSILDDIGESMDDPVEQDKIYQGILKEVGIETENSMPEVGTNQVKPETQKVEEKKSNVEEDSLDAMLKSLQK